MNTLDFGVILLKIMTILIKFGICAEEFRPHRLCRRLVEVSLESSMSQDHHLLLLLRIFGFYGHQRPKMVCEYNGYRYCPQAQEISLFEEEKACYGLKMAF